MVNDIEANEIGCEGAAWLQLGQVAGSRDDCNEHSDSIASSPCEGLSACQVCPHSDK
jgi:hypothetical protein